MKVSLFNRMPYGPVDGRTTTWPLPNAYFDPQRAVRRFAEANANFFCETHGS